MPRISTDNYDTVASWNGSQDLFVVEQPDGTKVATPAMVKQYVLGNSLESVRDYVNELGVKNLIPYPYYDTTKTIGTLTFTDNGDGSITVNGTATQNSTFYLTPQIWNNEEIKGKVILSAGGAPFNNSFKLTVETPLGTNKNLEDNGELPITITAPIRNIRLFVANGTTVDNVTVYPMIRLASDINDDTYVPFAMTNKQLTEEIGDLSQTGLAGDSVAEQLGTAKGEITGINSRLTSMNSFRIGSIIGSSGTLVQQCVAFARNIKNTYGMINAFEGMFYYSSSSRPSDIPANETIWTYASGKFLIRTVDGNDNVDATIILFAYAASKIAIKTVGNSAQASNWSILGA